MITSPASASFSQLIKAKALDLGLDACGITKARRMDEESKRLLAWLQEGHQGSMAFMENNLEKMVNPA